MCKPYHEWPQLRIRSVLVFQKTVTILDEFVESRDLKKSIELTVPTLASRYYVL